MLLSFDVVMSNGRGRRGGGEALTAGQPSEQLPRRLQGDPQDGPHRHWGRDRRGA